MNFNATYERYVVNSQGDMEITFKVDSYRDREIAKTLEGGKVYRLQAVPFKSQRTINQNRLMWAIIHEIAVAVNGDRATPDDDFKIYLEALMRSGAKYTVMAVKAEAEDYLKKKFRAIRYINTFTTEKGVEMKQYQVFYGSSEMNTKEMSVLLDAVLDMAAEADISVESEI